MTQSEFAVLHRCALPLLCLALAVPEQAAARSSLGVFESWGAFRDERPLRCYAIAEPVRPARKAWPAFASVGTWPASRVRGQVHVRLPRIKRPEAPLTLIIAGRRFPLIGTGADAWAPDPRADAAIVAAMRSAPSMRVEARAASGSFMSMSFALKGAATAMDAAALGCAR